MLRYDVSGRPVPLLCGQPQFGTFIKLATFRSALQLQLLVVLPERWHALGRHVSRGYGWVHKTMTERTLEEVVGEVTA